MNQGVVETWRFFRIRKNNYRRFIFEIMEYFTDFSFWKKQIRHKRKTLLGCARRLLDGWMYG
jgi:hypothetical protein